MIKAITFDFWSTLYESKPVDYKARVKLLQQRIERGCGETVSPEQFQAVVATARTAWEETWVQHYRTMGAGEWLSIVLDRLNISLEADYFLHMKTTLENGVFDNLPTPAPEIEETLAHLSTRYSLGVISDTGLTPGYVLRQILEQDNLAQYFSHFTFSDELGRSKPHPQAFLHTLNALNAEPRQSVHVGDLLRTDVAGAQGVGMRGVQYTGLNVDAQPDITPDALIQNHTELQALLDVWNE